MHSCVPSYSCALKPALRPVTRPGTGTSSLLGRRTTPDARTRVGRNAMAAKRSHVLPGRSPRRVLTGASQFQALINSGRIGTSVDPRLSARARCWQCGVLACDLIELQEARILSHLCPHTRCLHRVQRACRVPCVLWPTASTLASSRAEHCCCPRFAPRVLCWLGDRVRCCRTGRELASDAHKAIAENTAELVNALKREASRGP